MAGKGASMTLGGVADGATHFVAPGLRQAWSDTALDTAWAEPPAQRANRKGQQQGGFSCHWFV